MNIRYLFLLATLPLAPLAHADTDSVTADTSDWSFVIAPYAWLAGTGGTITTDGVDQDFDLSHSGRPSPAPP